MAVRKERGHLLRKPPCKTRDLPPVIVWQTCLQMVKIVPNQIATQCPVFAFLLRNAGMGGAFDQLPRRALNLEKTPYLIIFILLDELH